jgi:hypothetical protein
MKLTDDKIASVSRAHRVDPAATKAVIAVETPFPHLGDSRHGPLILFERHIFFRESGKAPVSRTHPHLSNRTPGGYCTGRNWEARQQCEHQKLAQARAIRHPEVDLNAAALRSVSMGLFQIMGFNHRLIDQPDPVRMWERYLKRDDVLDLEDFFRFCTNTRLLRHLQSLDWTSFARGYNGPAFARNNYDQRLAQHYAKYKRENTPLAQVHGLDHGTDHGFPVFDKTA